MSQTACDFAIAAWQSVGLAVAMTIFGVFFLWLWFIKLGRGDWSDHGREEEGAMSFSFDAGSDHPSRTQINSVRSQR